MEKILVFSLLVLHGTSAASLPASPQGLQDLEHPDISSGTPLAMVMEKDQPDQQTAHRDLKRYEKHGRPKPKVISMLDEVVDEVLQEPDDLELRNAVTQLIKEVENRHAKKHRLPVETNNDINMDPDHDETYSKIIEEDADDNIKGRINLNDLIMMPKPDSEIINFVGRDGLRHGQTDVKNNVLKLSPNGKPLDGHESDKTTANSDEKTVIESGVYLSRLANLPDDLNVTVVDYTDMPVKLYSKKADSKYDTEGHQVKETLIDGGKINEGLISFRSWASDNFNDQRLKNDDKYNDLIDLKESKQSIHFTGTGDIDSVSNSNNNNNGEDINLRKGNNEVDAIINEEISQNDLNLNLPPVIINDLLYNDLLNDLEGSTLIGKDNNLNEDLRADTAALDDNRNVDDSLRAGTPTDSPTSLESRHVESGEIGEDTLETHHHRHRHLKEKEDSSEEINEHVLEKKSSDCKGRNEIYNLSFRF